MKTSKKTIKYFFLALALGLASCKKKFEKYPQNPNLPGEEDVVPAEFLLRTVLFEIHQGPGAGTGFGGGESGSVQENVFQQISRWSQYTTGLTFPLYGGSNEYNWSNSSSPYRIIRNVNQMEKQATTAFGEESNPYLTLAKFIKAYSYIWYTQRVGDIPMSEAGMGLDNPTPKFDKQKDVYLQCMELLEQANEELTSLQSGVPAATLNGDIFFNGNLDKWQRTVNAFYLRVLISLSKRADDTPELRIKERFSGIIQDPSKYPLMMSNDDNFAFKWVPVQNRPDVFFVALYANETTVASTILDITSSTEDPRTFVFATPAPAEIAGGKSIEDFSAYVGSPNGTAQGTLFANASEGMYSYINYLRYLDNTVDNYPEDKVIVGYAEQCFNIAEGINRGWASGSESDFYESGILASLAFFGLEEGTVLEVGNVTGVPYGEVSVSIQNFMNHPDVQYAGGNQGLEQIITQKYVAFWQTGSWEPFYNYRRTGFPAFDVGPGTNPQQQIPNRWRYSPAEIQNNPNAGQAIASQFGADDIFAEMWLIKN
jgi:hypothetical protein